MKTNIVLCGKTGCISYGSNLINEFNTEKCFKTKNVSFKSTYLNLTLIHSEQRVNERF